MAGKNKARRVGWKTLVKTTDKDFHKPEPQYEFSNGRKFIKRKPTPGQPY